MMHHTRIVHRFDRHNAPSLRNWQAPEGPVAESLAEDVVIDCGWGRLIFAHTFADHARLADTLCEEKPGRRDIALYLRDPHVLLSLAPQELFLDPSHTYRLWLNQYRPRRTRPQGFIVRKLQSEADVEAINRIYAMRNMVPVEPGFVWESRKSRLLSYLVAEDATSGEVIGTVTGSIIRPPSLIPKTAPACGAWRSIRRPPIPASARTWCGAWRSTIWRGAGPSWTCR